MKEYEPDSPAVVEEIIAGDCIYLTEVRKHLPMLSKFSLHRYVHSGVKTPDGFRVRLEYARVGARYVTSMAAIKRFISLSTGEQPPLEQPSTKMERDRRGRHATIRKREIAESRERLKALGI